MAFDIVCAFESRIWPLCGRNYSRRTTRIQAEISCILTISCDISDAWSEKIWRHEGYIWHTQQCSDTNLMKSWGVTLADLKKGCQAQPMVVEFSTHNLRPWFILKIVNCIFVQRTWAFLKIKWKCCSRVFNRLQAGSQPAVVFCIECFDWLALESNAMSWGLKDTLFLWDLDDMFVHNPAISSSPWEIDTVL